jgi:hypothetical protein
MRSIINNYNNGDYRTIRRFALLPIFTQSEMCWLEWCVIEQQYSSNYADDGWHNIRFV